MTSDCECQHIETLLMYWNEVHKNQNQNQNFFTLWMKCPKSTLDFGIYMSPDVSHRTSFTIKDTTFHKTSVSPLSSGPYSGVNPTENEEGKTYPKYTVV